jgi:intracellular sulfur oxidation DsrE/DsrF family protein
MKCGWIVLCAAATLSSWTSYASDHSKIDSTRSGGDTQIHVDIPVVLERADVVFNMDHRAFVGDMPVGMNYMRLLTGRFREMNTKGQIIAVFHGDAAYMTLNDRAYNAYRKVGTGNPYRELIANLLAAGVQLEECAVSMKNNLWVNGDLLPGIKINSGAVGRLVQLVQKGFVQIEP